MSFMLNLDTASERQGQICSAARARRIALGLTQSDLAARSGVPLATLKRFEQTGKVSLSALLALAEVLDALDGFGALFPPVEATRLDDLEQPATRQRVRKRKKI